MCINKYTEKEREIDIIETVDVLVVGGGPSGIAAAVGAARLGASTMIIEALGSFGGMWTNGLVITLGGFNSWLSPYTRCVDGIMGEWLRMAEKLKGAENNRSWVLSSDPEIMKITADELLLSNNVKCLLHTWMADVIMDNNKVCGAIIENVEGRKAIKAKVVVDCTGNGDVMAKAGAEFEISPDLQPMTLPFFLANVIPDEKMPYDDELIIPIGPKPGFMGKDILQNYTSRRRDVNVDNDKLNKAYQENTIPCFGGPWFGGLRKNYPWVNTTRLYGSPINATDLTAAEMKARKDVYTLVEFYKKNLKGFESCWIMNTASTIGIRESRRLKGVYKMTKNDIQDNHTVKDAVAMGTWPIDVHPPKGATGMHDMYVPTPYGISYSSMLPNTIDNLIVTGRCISADREAMGSMRVGATCGAIGHAAGVAAAISAIRQIHPRNVPYDTLKSELLKQKAIIE